MKYFLIILFPLLLAFDCPNISITVPASPCIGIAASFTSTVTVPGSYQYYWSGGMGAGSQMYDSVANPDVVIPIAGTFTVVACYYDSSTGCNVCSDSKVITVDTCR